MASVVEAYTSGQVWMQRFLKNASSTFTTGWIDAAYTSGQPAYDARVGIAGEFNPIIATKNDAIYFPEISATQQRYLAELTFRGLQSGSTSAENIIVFDLLGYYPLLDGDSADSQVLDNTQTLPRYSTGAGVQMCLVNHVAPQVGAGSVTIAFTDTDNVSRTVSVAVPLVGVIGAVVSASDSTTSMGSPFVPLGAGCKGVKSVQSVIFDTPPGGAYCLYLVKPLIDLSNYSGTGNNSLAKQSINLVQNGFHMPRIYDGAALSWLHYHTGTTSTTSWFGYFKFIWK